MWLQRMRLQISTQWHLIEVGHQEGSVEAEALCRKEGIFSKTIINL